MVKSVVKRDGVTCEFNKEKIVDAIMGAMTEVNEIDANDAQNIATTISKKRKTSLGVEEIQDMVEEQLMEKHHKVARAYITYRNERTRRRRMKTQMMKDVTEKVFASNVVNSNANVDEYSFGGRKNEAAGVVEKEIADDCLLDDVVKKYKNDNLLYIHDYTEYPIGDHNCLFADVGRLTKDGFDTRNGGVRGARSFSTACQLVAVIFQIQSQNQFGGVASAHIDDDLAPFVRMSFLKHYQDGLKYVDHTKRSYESFKKKYTETEYYASISAEMNIFNEYSHSAYQYAIDMLEKEGKQSAEALYHNLNTLESRPGSQLPFTSINFGLNTTFEGRCVSRWLLNASINGIGQFHQTPIFPISIFKYKRGINDKKGTPNYDLYQLAIKSLTKRIYPNIVNCDWESNIPDANPEITPNCKCVLTKDDTVIVYGEKTTVSDLWKSFSSDTIINSGNPVIRSVAKFNIPIKTENHLYSDELDKTNSLDESITKLLFMTYNRGNHTYGIGTKSNTYTKISLDGIESLMDNGRPAKYEYDTEMATMGAVDGGEVITYKLPDGKLHVETFKEAWNRANNYYGEPIKYSTHSAYINTPDMTIYDSSSNGFVSVKRMTRNDDMGRWMRISSMSNTVLLTSDHPLPTKDRGRIEAKDLTVHDEIMIVNGQYTEYNDDDMFTTSKEEIMFEMNSTNIKTSNLSYDNQTSAVLVMLMIRAIGKKATIRKESDKYIVAYYDEDATDKLTWEPITSIEFIGNRGEYEYDVETESDRFDVSGINSHNCRTLIGYDVNGMGYKKTGRGNIVPITMVLPKLGIENGICLGKRKKANVKGFFKDLNDLLDVSEKSLIDRYKFICSQNVRAGRFMYSNGDIADGKEAWKTGKIEDAMKHGTLAFGYIGIANTCYAMFGKYHNQSKESYNFALKIMDTIAKRAKEATKRHHLNFSVYSSPAENCCYSICSKLKKEYGDIKGVLDKGYLTNSLHIPVFENISIEKKLELESKLAKNSTGGEINYVELESSVIHNHKAVESIINYAMKVGIPYLAINFPIDNCADCGTHVAEMDTECPVCGGNHIYSLRRVTGYLSTDYHNFNDGKIEEVKDRVKHSSTSFVK